MKTRSKFFTMMIAGVLFTIALSAQAKLRLPAVISEHAVVQADKPIAIWGWAEPGETVRVAVGAGNALAEGFVATAAADGRWAGELPPMKAGVSCRIIVKTDKGESVEVPDLLVGEVWLAGGQSNMSYLVNSPSRNKNEATTPELLAAAKSEASAAGGSIRYFATSRVIAETPMPDVTGKWIIATPETVGGCFALSWNFAVALHDKIHVPVGLIDSAIGGTVVEAWTPRPELDACAAGPDLEKRYAAKLDKFPAAEKAKFASALAEWTKKYPTPELQRENASSKPMADAGRPNYPARLYNGMIHGLEPYTLKGVIWFQGDGNCPHPQDYGILIKTMITAWRAHFHDAKLPFYYVEMQNYGKPQVKPVEPNALSEIREQQQAAFELPATDVATGVDQGIAIPNYEAHFPDKKPLGRRLAGLALDHLYGQPGLVHSPAFKSFKIEGNKIRLQFQYADGLRLRGHAELAGFAIRAADGEWVWAKGQIDGQDIVVWSDQIAKPAQVRYGWAWHPILSVENSAGLPLRPFRTDTGSEH
jgi:sialate O-acetylesterase